MDLSKLTIITQNQDPLVKKMSSTELTTMESKTNINLSQSLKSEQMDKRFSEFRSGKLSENDFNRKVMKIDQALLQSLDENTRNQTRKILLETLNWFIQLKILISTSTTIENFVKTLDQSNQNDSILRLFKTLNDLELNHKNIDYKELSLSVGNLLKLLLTDDIINPKYKIDSKMVNYLSNYRPTYLKEITVLFDLYSKVYDQLSKDLVNNIETVIKPFRSVSEIQPRFDMINRHILSSNLDVRIDYDLDLDKLQVDPGYEIKTSELGLTKRLNQLNDWLINGIVNIQTQINRLNNLKPVSVPGKQISSLLVHANREVITPYHIWEILKDTSKFLETLKGITDGTGFVTGVASIDLLDTLNVNY